MIIKIMNFVRGMIDALNKVTWILFWTMNTLSKMNKNE